MNLQTQAGPQGDSPRWVQTAGALATLRMLNPYRQTGDDQPPSHHPGPPPSQTPGTSSKEGAEDTGTAQTPTRALLLQALPAGGERASYLLRRKPRAGPPPAARSALPAPPASASSLGLPAWGPRPWPAPPRAGDLGASGPPWGRQAWGTGVAAPPRGVFARLPGLGPLGNSVVAPGGAQATRPHLPGQTTLRAKGEEGA